MGLNMKRSAFQGQSGHTSFSKGFLCALSISGVCQGVICVFCAAKLKGLAHADLAKKQFFA